MPRPLLRAAAAAAVLLLALTGCSSGSEQPEAGGTAPTGAFPVTLNHAFGATTIPAEPRRVVAVGLNDSDFLLSLGVVPVGSREFTGGFDWENRAWAQQSLGGQKPPALIGTEVPVEQIASLKPDLILGVYSFLDKTTYEALSKIAPTVAQSTPDGTDAAPWPEQMRITGQAVGRTQQADEVIAATRTKFDDAKAAHPAFAGRSLKMDFVVGGTPINLGTDDLRAQLFAGLGFRVPADTQNLSREQQGQLDADVLVVMGRSRAEAMADPVFANIPAVRAGRVAFLGGYTTEFAGALGFSSPLSLPYAIDSVAPKLDAALKGQPQGT
ncbi:iron-siderophore ABC transporter substrate-binding protein [Pseudonocardia sp. KRD291]|uniref:iron-siderophore ABC transporter substrate-binding protein n=1 Tax=Pseudonocardia sp. KRD291 TaxID=2792007 RepID=UPI001C4A129E|nr:iron-siderophore ABC transporter substrate-binding protein [Pseudonocardia sp. KRD291]MBW0101290.1 iron-siderophore ABC transporter substrate-binding protein [Pseudonocardia sp. KRD291]